MTDQTAKNVIPTILWDDSVVFVFSWQYDGQTWQGGFLHQQLSIATQTGFQTQVSPFSQQLSSQQGQISSDSQSWLEAIKTAARGKGKVTVAFEDSNYVLYTTQTNITFNLQQLFSITG